MGYIIPSLIAGLKRISTFISDIKGRKITNLQAGTEQKILKHKNIKNFEPMSELSNSYNFLSEVKIWNKL